MYYYTPRELSSGEYIGICLSVCLSVCLCRFVSGPLLFFGLTLTLSRYDLQLWPQGQIYRVFDMFLCLAHNFFGGDIGLPYLAHGCITIRRCVAYIHDPDTTLNFDLKVKFIGFLTCFCVRSITIFWFDIGLPYLEHWSITMSRYDMWFKFPIRCWPLTSRSNL